MIFLRAQLEPQRPLTPPAPEEHCRLAYFAVLPRPIRVYLYRRRVLFVHLERVLPRCGHRQFERWLPLGADPRRLYFFQVARADVKVVHHLVQWRRVPLDPPPRRPPDELEEGV